MMAQTRTCTKFREYDTQKTIEQLTAYLGEDGIPPQQMVS